MTLLVIVVMVASKPLRGLIKTTISSDAWICWNKQQTFIN